MNRATQRLGKSGEYFTASVLSLISDYVIVNTDGAQADVLFEHKKDFLKVQVKTKSKRNNKKPGWKFDIRRGSHSKERFFRKGYVDLFALYCAKYKKILFFPFHKTINEKGHSKTCIYVTDDKMKNADSMKSLKSALNSIKEYNKLKSN
tara:strand:+ start:1571 stop:2017 length:447 start_codon:yes stop_codon:yes gene_type:complete